MISSQTVITRPEPVSQSTLHASFLGIMGGEFLKVARLFWWMLVLLALGFIVAFWLGANS